MASEKIKISGYIGWDTDLAMVQSQLIAANGNDLSVEVSSIGGDVQVGSAIYNAISDYAKMHGASVDFVVMGWAESAASYATTMPGATVKVHRNSLYMYHNPVANGTGDYNKIAKKAAWLEKMTGFYAEAYASKSGKDIESIRTEMDAETYLLGQEIVDAGFADELIDDSSVGMSAPKEELIKKSREEYHKAMTMVSGGKKDKNKSAAKPEKTNNEEVIMTEENKESKELELKAANERASACMTAMAALPAEYHKDIQDAFAKGESAGYFTGMVAHAKMVGSKTAAEKEKATLKMAAEDSGEIPDLNLDSNAGQKPVVMAAAGSTGQKVKVG